MRTTPTRLAFAAAAMLALSACKQDIPFTAEYRCAAAMAPKLKDPDSIRVLSVEKVEGIKHTMRYSATNGFGARVSNTAACYLMTSGADMVIANYD